MNKDKIVCINISIIIMGVFCLPLLLSILTIFADVEDNLSGTVDEQVQVELSLVNIFDGKYQQSIENQFTNSFYGRNEFVKLYDDFMYKLHAYNNTIYVGTNEWLFGDEYVRSAIGEKDNSYISAHLEEYAKNIAYIQQVMRSNGKVFVYVVSDFIV